MKTNSPNYELFNQLFAIPSRWHNVLYVHTPFCIQKCYYCVYSSKEPKDSDEMNRFYREILSRQIQEYMPTLESHRFQQIYFGGGTPTITDAANLASLYNQIPHFNQIPIKVTEASPYTVTDDHLDLFGERGFNYVSLGVQTLSPRLLEAQNRKVVGKEKLTHICRRLDKFGIISNIDLIFYLDSGGLDDLHQTRRDLEEVMGDIRPVSITLHSNYLVEKSMEKQSAMMQTIREMLAKHQEYRCVNATLEYNETEFDMKNAAEYRLMRDREAFHFYMSPKIPQSHAYGHNMLALGTYEEFKPRYNYYYVYDFADKYSYKSLYRQYKAIAEEFISTRQKLGLPCQDYAVPESEDFFTNQEHRQQFKKVVKSLRLPYYDASKL